MDDDARLFELADPAVPLIEYGFIKRFARIEVNEWAVLVIPLILDVAAANARHLKMERVGAGFGQPVNNLLLLTV